MSAGVDGGMEEVLRRLKASTKISRPFDGVQFTGKSLKLNSAEDAQPIVDAINNCKTPLDYLNLEGNTLGVEAAIAIANALENKPELRVAWWKDMFTGRSKEEIPKALIALSKSLIKAGARLTVLELSDNASGPIGADALSELISSKVCWGLEELRLANMGLGITGAQKLAVALNKCLTDSKAAGTPLSLKVFIAGRNRLENTGSIALAEVLKKIGTLEEIQIYQNAIYHPGFKVLSEAFSCNRSLKVLNLNDNTITQKGAVHLSEALEKLPNLEVLNLGDCLLHSKGAKLIAPALKKLDKLKELDLSSNEINGATAEEIVKSLENKSKLKSLRMGANEFGSKVVSLEEAIHELCGSNPGFTLSMSDNESENEGEEENSEDGSEGEEEEEIQDEYDYDEEEDGDKDEEEEEEEDSDAYSNDDVYPLISPMRRDYSQPPFKHNTTEVPSPKLEITTPSTNLFDLTLSKLEGLTVEDQTDELLVKIAKVLPSSKASTDEVNNLFKKLFEVAQTSSSISLVNNLLPAYVGLVKSEKKTGAPNPVDFQTSVTILKEAMKQDYFPQSTRDVINFLLNGPQEMNNN